MAGFVRVLCVIMICFLPVVLLAQGTITAEGFGESEDAALNDALRNAVQQGVGTIIAAETISANYQMLSDQILNRSAGFVRSYTELNKRQESDGVWRITVSAEVHAIQDTLLTDQLARELLYRFAGSPRFLVLLDDSDSPERGSASAEIALIERFIDNGIDVVEPTQIENLRSKYGVGAILSAEAATLAALGTETGASIIILGNARAEEATQFRGQLGPMRSVNAVIQARVFRADTGEIICAGDATGREVSVTVVDAVARAYREAADSVSKEFLLEVLRLWSQQQSSPASFDVSITGVNYSLKNQLIEYLRTQVDGIHSVQQLRYSDRVLELNLDFMGSIETLGARLNGIRIDGAELEIVGEELHSLQAVME